MCSSSYSKTYLLSEGSNGVIFKRFGTSVHLFEKTFVEVAGVFIDFLVMPVIVLHSRRRS